MTITLWIINIVLALAFLAAGAMKLVKTREALVAGGMGWAEDFSAPIVKVIGALEIIGALGLVVPLATGVAEVLTPLAATGLAVVMVCASVVHVRRTEPPVPAAVLAALAAASAVLGFLVLA